MNSFPRLLFRLSGTLPTPKSSTSTRFSNLFLRHSGAVGTLLAAAWLASSPAASAAPYPPDGLAAKWRQADGTILDLRVFGDEFYARTETLDGYTVVYDPERRSYCFALPAAGNEPLGSSNVPANRTPPESLAKHLKQPEKVAAAIRNENIRRHAPNRAAKWSERVKATEVRRRATVNPSRAAAPVNRAGSPVSGSKVGLVILVQFPDDPATPAIDPVNFPTSRAKIIRFCNQTGYQEDGNAGSIRDYFVDQSNGALTFTQSVTPVVTLPHPRAFYNYSDYPTNKYLPGNGASGRMMLEDAIAILKSTGFDFTGLTADSSGQVLATSILFAGPSSGLWSYGLWPHSSSITPINVGPCTISGYQCTDVEDKAPTIGTMCHELGHLLLDYPDLYDTNGSDGSSHGVGEHCLMGSGNQLDGGKCPAPINLYLKEISGWAVITDLTPSQTLDASLPSTGNQGFRIRKPGSATEYFLVENRGPGDRWSRACCDQGVAIWHVDEAVTRGNQEQHMTASQHYEISLEQADGKFDLEHHENRGDNRDLFDSQTAAFNNSTLPDADWWDGSASGISIWVTTPALPMMSVRFGASLPLDTLRLSATTRAVAPFGGAFTFAVKSSAVWSWRCDANWVVSDEAAGQTGNQSFGYRITENHTDSDREATIILKSGALIQHHTIMQSHAAFVAQNSSIRASFDYEGDEDYFRIDLPVAGTVILKTTGDWDTVGRLMDASGKNIEEVDQDGAGDNMRIRRTLAAGTYYLSIREYNEETGDYMLNFGFQPLQLEISAASRRMPARGGAFAFAVRSNTSWRWSGDRSWIICHESWSQKGDRTFTYSVLRNSSRVARSATLKFTCGVLTTTHVITQAAATTPHATLSLRSGMRIFDVGARDHGLGALNSRSMPFQFTIHKGADKFLALAVSRTPDGATAPPVVEVSSNLVDWYSGEDHTTVVRNDPSLYQVRDNTPIRAGVKRYIRIRPAP